MISYLYFCTESYGTKRQLKKCAAFNQFRDNFIEAALLNFVWIIIWCCHRGHFFSNSLEKIKMSRLQVFNPKLHKNGKCQLLLFIYYDLPSGAIQKIFINVKL